MAKKNITTLKSLFSDFEKSLNDKYVGKRVRITNVKESTDTGFEGIVQHVQVGSFGYCGGEAQVAIKFAHHQRKALLKTWRDAIEIIK